MNKSGAKYTIILVFILSALLLASCADKAEADIYNYNEEDYIEEAEEEIFDDEEISGEDEDETSEAKNTADENEDTVYGLTLYELEDKFTGGYEGTSDDLSSIVIGFTQDKKEAFYATENADSTNIVYACGLCAREGDNAYSITDSNTLEIIRFTITENPDGKTVVTTTDAELFTVEKKGAESVCMDFMASVLAAPSDK
ncbi:MAG: hypothetical protein K5886_12185 [Lachnospiraceae bacterium]|nr:hypothetical protein [Lachnospiraceae bacterium]